MDNKSYSTEFYVSQTPHECFQAIKNFRGWWSEDIEGVTDKLNETFFYHYKDIHLSKLKLSDEVPDKKLVYDVVDNQFSFTQNKNEWRGTKLVFEVSEHNGKTKVKFTHDGLISEEECYEVCTDAWGNYINNSLQHFISTGRGEPNPKEADGFNAEIVKKWKLK
ncbi:SRPBCC domain-containing protein [Elizabethkingia meningoseptica]|uniref:SRPBCC domain-containing protein n=1 Tax=Elizabethkingia meningoseptica TaxID=238 RepID=UPI0023B13518|nr:SRPBCC domain-containing protein [Elizabethkingia meningoseptica]MDE5492776.1 SRPBCC domain-containing protein [Elizabethkingia meningoseptica]